MFKKISLIVFTIAFSGFCFAEGVRLSNPKSVDMSADRLERIGDYMDRAINNGDLAGAVTLVARGGKIVHLESHGKRYIEENISMTDDTIFRIASMTKPIACIALMMLYEEGHFVLDDPISKWLPAYKNMQVRETDANGNAVLVAANRPVTVRDVMSHSVGFQNSNIGPRPATVEEQVNIIATKPLDAHPGSKWQYRSATNQVGVLVEKISGMTLDEFLSERLFKPLGMNDTHFYVPVSKLSRVAAIYEPGDNGGLTLTSPPRVTPASQYFSGSGGLSSTIHDYFRIQQMMLNGGELDGKRYLSPTTINLMLSNHIGDNEVGLIGEGYGFGLGYAVLTDPGKSFTHLPKGSSSWGGAFGTMFWIMPEEDMLAIVMAQIRPYSHLRYREIFGGLSLQAITESWKNRDNYKIHANNF